MGRPRELVAAKTYALYLDAPTIEMLKRTAQQRGCNISQLVREMASKLESERERNEQESEDKTAA